MVGQDHVEHRDLVDDDQVGGEGLPGVVLEAPGPGLPAQEAVHGARLAARRLRQPLGGAAGRRREEHARPCRLGELDDQAHDGGLAHARTAGQERDRFAQEPVHGGALVSVQLDRGVPLRGPYAVGVGERVDGRCLEQPAQVGRQSGLRRVVHRQVDQLAVGLDRVVADHLALAGELRQVVGEDGGRRRQPQELGRLLEERVALRVRVTRVGAAQQGEQEARAAPFGRVLGQAQVAGRAVRGVEADAPDAAREEVGVGAQAFLRVGAVAPAHGLDLGAVEAQAEEERRELLGALVGAQGARELGPGALLQAGDPVEDGRFRADPGEGVRAQALDDALRQGGADAAEGARGQVADEPGPFERHQLLQLREVELAPVLRVGLPGAHAADALALEGQGGRPDGRHPAPEQPLGIGEAAFGAHPQDGIAGLGVAVGDPLDDALEGGRALRVAP